VRTLGNYFCLVVATGLGFGYAPKAPGTAGTVWGVVLFWAMAGWPAWARAVAALVMVLISWGTAEVAGRYYHEADCQHIVIDEVAGYLVGVVLVPFSWVHAGVVFVLFRVFDITKPFPASWFDRQVHNGFGVTMDDVVAGAYACGVFHLFFTWMRVLDYIS
jgi:phosphatidylglycerophosphatase A